MKLLPLLLLICVLALIVIQNIQKAAKNAPIEDLPNSPQIDLPIKGFYQPKWLFSYNEKDAYYQLKAVTEKYNLPIFAKVRLLDLVEPTKNNNPRYKTYFYKIQAKHVDFVICNEKLVAKLIIELDDSSHDSPNRQKRDAFIDEVLKSTGYSIIHTRAINKAEIETAIQKIIITSKS